MIYQKNELCALVADIATTEGLPPEFVLAIVDTLSSFNPALVEQSMDPQQYNPALSRNNAPESRLGLLQIGSDAARNEGYRQKQVELLEPRLNIEIGCKLLKKALEQTNGNGERSLLIVYGYSINTMIPTIKSKIMAYREFISLRPKEETSIR